MPQVRTTIHRQLYFFEYLNLDFLPLGYALTLVHSIDFIEIHPINTKLVSRYHSLPQSFSTTVIIVTDAMAQDDANWNFLGFRASNILACFVSFFLRLKNVPTKFKLFKIFKNQLMLNIYIR